MLLATLNDYFHFVTDPETNKLRRYLFDSNVRDFMGLNRVNQDIRTTLEDRNSPDFWWLNNGVTILSTAASVTGKSIQLQDIQIVNGLQTTESIYRHFSRGGSDESDRSVLIKVIVLSEEAIRDAIIKATNYQTSVGLASLYATDKIQRDIEDVLIRSGLYYERRRNFYQNLGHSSSDIITPLYLAAGYVNLIMKSPRRAAKLRQRFMHSNEAYKAVFSPRTPIKVWPKIAIALKKTDEVLERMRPTGTNMTERFLKKWRQITCFLAISRVVGKFDFSANELAKFDESQLTDSLIEDVWSLISTHVPRGINTNDWKKQSVIVGLCTQASQDYDISGIRGIEERNIADIKVDMEFALKVNAELPEQPWKRGIHKKITKKLECSSGEIASAIQMLIDEGIRNNQKDGVVYDSEGNVICFDPDRVDPTSMELLEDKNV